MEQKQTHLTYGLIGGLIMVVLNLGIYLGGLTFKPWAAWLGFIPFLVCIIMNAMAFSKANDANVTFKTVFRSGFKASMVITGILLVWSILSIFIFPEMKEKAIENAREQMAKNPQMTDEAMEMGMNMTRKGYNLIIILSTLFGGLLMGALFSVIAAAVAKKNVVVAQRSDNF